MQGWIRGAWGNGSTPPKFYYEQANRKILKVAVQVQLHFVLMHEQ